MRFASNGAVASTVQNYGTLPVGTSAPTAVVPLRAGNAVHGFALFDLNPAVPGNDTLSALNPVKNLL